MTTNVYFSFMLHVQCGSAGALFCIGSLWDPVGWSSLSLAGGDSSVCGKALARDQAKGGTACSWLSGILLRSSQGTGVSPRTQLSGNIIGFPLEIFVCHHTCLLYPSNGRAEFERG